MALNFNSLPTLSKVKPSIMDRRARPDRGKGIIYSIQWGFRIDKGNTYQRMGEYIGLTHLSAQERFFSHYQAAKSLSYTYGPGINRKKTSIIGGDRKLDDDSKTPKLFYIAFRTALGNKASIGINDAYRFISVLEHVNLFDLAHAEHMQITQKAKTLSPYLGFRSYEEIIDYVSKGSGKLGFNTSTGGEGNKINTGKNITYREVVMAAFYFITEGRGSGVLRSVVGIKGENMAEDISAVFKYFKTKAQGKYEKMNAAAPSHNKGKNPEKETPLEKYIRELGISYTKHGKGIVSQKEKAVNMFLKFSTGKKLNLSSFDIKAFVSAVDRGSGISDSNRGFDLSVLVGADKRSVNKITEAIKKQEFFTKHLPIVKGFLMLRSHIRKQLKLANLSPKDKPWDFTNEVWNKIYSDAQAAYNILERDKVLAPYVKGFRDKVNNRKSKKYQEYNESYD